ncbi:hypothetical protein Tco_1136809 [Tanacetum coccineum]
MKSQQEERERSMKSQQEERESKQEITASSKNDKQKEKEDGREAKCEETEQVVCDRDRVRDYDRGSRDRERHQDYGGECWVILMGYILSGSWVNG